MCEYDLAKALKYLHFATCGVNYVFGNIVLDIAESDTPGNLNHQAHFKLLYFCSCSQCRSSKIRRQALLFPITITGWLRSRRSADLLGHGFSLAPIPLFPLGPPCVGLGKRALRLRRKLFVG